MWEEYNAKIKKKILDQTKFKDNYQMVLIDTWMKITVTSINKIIYMTNRFRISFKVHSR